MSKCREAYNKILRDQRELFLKSAREEGWSDKMTMEFLEANYVWFKMGWNAGKSDE